MKHATEVDIRISESSTLRCHTVSLDVALVSSGSTGSLTEDGRVSTGSSPSKKGFDLGMRAGRRAGCDTQSVSLLKGIWRYGVLPLEQPFPCRPSGLRSIVG